MSAVLGLMGKKKDATGVWHRVCLNTIVRKGVNLDSERLRILPMGSKVFVVEQRDRRVRIEQPISGWCSVRSSNGDTILTPLEDNDQVPTTTPSAAAIKNENINVHTKAQDAQIKEEEARASFESQVNQLPEDKRANVKTALAELEALKGQLSQHAEIKKELTIKQLESEKLDGEYEELLGDQEQLDTEISEFRTRIEEIKQQMNEEAGHQFMEKYEVAETAASKVQNLEQEGERMEKLLHDTKMQNERLQKELTRLFFGNEEEENNLDFLNFRDGDVCMLQPSEDDNVPLPGGGLVIVRWAGQMDGESFLGVEADTETAFYEKEEFRTSGTSPEGEELFQTKNPECGFFVEANRFIKSLQAETLLNMLNHLVEECVLAATETRDVLSGE